MVITDGDFLKKLLSTFKVEAEEHVNTMSASLIELEKAHSTEERQGIIEIIFREAHSLKGAARAVNVTEIEKVCQALESVFAACKREEISLSVELFDTLHRTVDSLNQLVSALETRHSPQEKKQIAELIRQLQSALDAPTQTTPGASVTAGAGLVPARADERNTWSEASPVPMPTPLIDELKNDDVVTVTAPESDNTVRQVAQAQPTDGKSVQSKTIRIATTKLDTLLLQSEELLSTKLTARQRTAELKEVSDALARWEKEWPKVHADLRTMRQSVASAHERNGQGKADARLKRLLEFLDWNSNFLKSLETEVAMLTRAAEQDHHILGGMVDQLLEDMKKILMLPAASLLEVFPKVVRDLARDQGKEVELVTRGGETEIDRRILEEIKDPLLHLVRNAVDHGIEKPSERSSKNKPTHGTLMITIRPKSGSEVEILITDDGAGIDAQKVRAAALKSGVVAPEEVQRLGEGETLSLIFRSGISTSPIITDISGRGIGLAIVQEKVEKLGGELSLESHANTGTTFRIRVPLTLATFRGILMRAGEHLFILPTVNVKRVTRVSEDEIKTVENRETIRLDDKLISLVRLVDVLGLSPQSRTSEPDGYAHVVILGAAEKRIAFLVDEILDEQEVLVKSLGRQLARVRNIAGATILGTGQVVPILNVSDLLKSALQVTIAPLRAAVEKAAARKSILIAEDSITARTLLKNILESAGYDVKATVDGADALTELKAGDYDLLVSDVEMPRMSGFELTTKVREDKRLAELPVVLVTSLDSREDRERGIDVGANAYIVKSSFDQSNLLETVRRMI
jgi:two-component system chemotaxis sensor kinase CheA